MPAILIYDFRSATIKEKMPSNNDQYFHETKLKKNFLWHLFKYLGIPPQQVAVFKWQFYFIAPNRYQSKIAILFVN